MVVYNVTYAFTNTTSGFNSTNYSTGTVYLNNIKSNNLHVKSNIILSDSITSWTFPSMLGSQNTITLATSMTVSNGTFYNILSYTFPQIGVYNIQAQFCFILNSNTVNTFCLASLSTTSVTVDMFFQSTHLLPPMPGHNHYCHLNREMQITNTTTTLYMIAMANFCSSAAYLNNNLTYMKITRIA